MLFVLLKGIRRVLPVATPIFTTPAELPESIPVEIVVPKIFKYPDEGFELREKINK